jgi:hypothetical protein
LKGLEIVGAPKEVLSFFKAYLEGTSTRIRLPNGELSSTIHKSLGTPQGDPLSPYLFVIWLNIHLQSLHDSPVLGYRFNLSSPDYKATAMADDVAHLCHGEELSQSSQALPQIL